MPELLCQNCDRGYPVWFAPDELWNKVAREDEHFLCPTCFAVLAEARGFVPLAWVLTQKETAAETILSAEQMRRKLNDLVETFDSNGKAAKAFGVAEQYLSQMKTGKQFISKKVLDKMGYRAKKTISVVYVEVKMSLGKKLRQRTKSS
jgi:hypothetical protein